MSKKKPLSHFAPHRSCWPGGIPSVSRVNRWGCPHADHRFRTVRTPVIAHVSQPSFAHASHRSEVSSALSLTHPHLPWLWISMSLCCCAGAAWGRTGSTLGPTNNLYMFPLWHGNPPGVHGTPMWVPSEGSQRGWWERPVLRVNWQAGISEMHPRLCLCQCLGIKPVVELLRRCLRCFRWA